jgi:hypothetical protein
MRLTFKNYDGGSDAVFQRQVEIQVEIGAQRQRLTVGDQRNGE